MRAEPSHANAATWLLRAAAAMLPFAWLSTQVPAVIWALALPLIAMEIVLQLGEAGIMGGPDALLSGTMVLLTRRLSGATTPGS